MKYVKVSKFTTVKLPKKTLIQDKIDLCRHTRQKGSYKYQKIKVTYTLDGQEDIPLIQL